MFVRTLFHQNGTYMSMCFLEARAKLTMREPDLTELPYNDSRINKET
jgi:primosomal protein N''